MKGGSDALVVLQLTLQRWQNPSVWDRIIQDEPLDPVDGRWVDNVATNFTSTGTITIPLGTAVTTNTGVVLVHTGYSDIEHRSVAQLQRDVDRDVFKAIERACAFGDPKSTRAPGQRWEPETWVNGNEPYPEVHRLPYQLPYARNHKEKRILKSLARRLPQMIRKAEMVLGERGEMAQDKWNAAFWDMVTRENPAKDGPKRKV